MPKKHSGTRHTSLAFSETIQKIGINPYVSLPPHVLTAIFAQAKKEKSPIPVQGTLNGHAFTQTLVRYQGAWRLYLNTPMRVAAGIDVGDTAHVVIAFDPSPRTEQMNPALAIALTQNAKASAAFTALIPSRQKEILRYLNAMKTEASLTRNVGIIVKRLLGKKPKGLQVLARIFE